MAAAIPRTNLNSLSLQEISKKPKAISPVLRFCLLGGLFVLAGPLRLNHINQPLVDPFSFKRVRLHAKKRLPELRRQAIGAL